MIVAALKLFCLFLLFSVIGAVKSKVKHETKKSQAATVTGKKNGLPITLTVPSVASIPVIPPPDCIKNISELVYVNGELSTSSTIFNCLNNIGDAYSIPTYYNGTFHSALKVYTNIQLNNLHDVSKFLSCT